MVLPGFLEHDQVLVIEGELNGMAAWLAAPELGVMAVAGTNGALHLEALKGRTVYVYADADDTGQKARDRWAAQALEAGATKVYTLAPWPADACDLAGKEGRPALRERLTLSMAEARPVEPEGKPAAPESEPDEKEPRRSQASELYDLVKTSGAELFHTPDDEPHITITVDGHLETYRLKSKGARAWLRHLYRAETGKTIGGQALQDALNDLEGVALFDGREHGVFVRLAWDADDVVLDLGDSSHRVVRVNRTGYRIETISPVKFVRPKALAALPVPEAGGSISELWELLNISDDDRPLVTGWLVAALRPSGPYPILALHGEQGSAKSTTARALRALVDPSTAPLRSEPRDARDLMIAATSSWAPAFDNISSISPALSDALCILSTGGGFASRALYTDDEEVILTAQRPVILTGIADVATRPDLLDRCLVLYLPRIKDGERRPESTFWRAFGEAHGRILGALLTAVSAGLRGVDTVKLAELPRMADFAIWAVACEESTVPKVDGFITRYGANRAAANELALDATPLPQVLRELVEGQPERTWQGNATELLAALNLLLQNRQDDRTPKLKEWPKRADKLSGAVRRYAPNLRATGLEVDFTQETTGQKRKLIILRRVGQTSETSETSETELDDDREGREKGGFASSFANDASFATSETGQSSETRSETGEITSSTAQTPAGFASSASFAKKSSCSKRWEIEL